MRICRGTISARAIRCQELDYYYTCCPRAQVAAASCISHVGVLRLTFFGHLVWCRIMTTKLRLDAVPFHVAPIIAACVFLPRTRPDHVYRQWQRQTPVVFAILQLGIFPSMIKRIGIVKWQCYGCMVGIIVLLATPAAKILSRNKTSLFVVLVLANVSFIISVSAVSGATSCVRCDYPKTCRRDHFLGGINLPSMTDLHADDSPSKPLISWPFMFFSSPPGYDRVDNSVDRPRSAESTGQAWWTVYDG